MHLEDGSLAEAAMITRRGEGPNPIDIHVGNRLRSCRTMLGITQEKLGEAVGITFQQLQKYERGINRISASRLFNLSQVLGVPVCFFFDELPTNMPGESRSMASGLDETDEVVEQLQEFAPEARRETLELVRAYYRIGESPVRRRAFDLIRALGGHDLTYDEVAAT